MEEQAKACDLILEKIDKIVGIPHLSILDTELHAYLEVFTKVKTKEYSSYDEFKSDITLKKVVHYSHYSEFTSPIITVLTLYLSQLNLLYDYINYYNSLEVSNVNTYKKTWFELVTEKYTLLSKQFADPLPCIEGYITDLEKELAYIQKEPEKPVDMIPKRILSIDDFKSDGGFEKRRKDYDSDWKIVGLTMKTFRAAVCGKNISCDEELEIIGQTYNLTNFKTYLSYIKFYEKYPEISEEQVLNIIEDAGGIEDDHSGKICCLKNILSGGKKTRRHRKSKNKKRKSKRKAYKN